MYTFPVVYLLVVSVLSEEGDGLLTNAAWTDGFVMYISMPRLEYFF